MTDMIRRVLTIAAALGIVAVILMLVVNEFAA